MPAVTLASGIYFSVG